MDYSRAGVRRRLRGAGGAAVPALRRHGARRAAAGAAARRPLGLRHRQPLREGRAPAPGAVVPRAAGRRQSVRDQRDLHADPLPRAQVGRVLPARRHRRAGAGRWPSSTSARRRAAARHARAARSTLQKRRRRGRVHLRASTDRRRRKPSTWSSPTPTCTTPTLGSTRATPAADAARARLERMDWSMSLFVVYFGTRPQVPGHAPTTRCCSGRATASCCARSSTARRCPPTSASTCTSPPSPIPAWRRPGARRSTCWRRCRTSAPPTSTGQAAGAAPTPTASSAALETQLPDLRQRDRGQAHRSRRSTFAIELNAFQGSAFSLAPRLTQSAYFRPHNRDPTHPRPLHRRAPGRTRARACPA